MPAGNSKNWVETLLAFLEDHVPKPLRKSLILALAVLAVSFSGIKAYFGFDASNVISSSYFLTILTAVLLGFGIQILNRVHRPWSYTLSPVLLMLAVGTGVLSWDSWRYFYNPVGVYEERAWRVDSRNRDECILSWRLIAAGNSPNGVILRVTTKFKACPQVTIQNLHPVVTGLDLEGAETGEQSPSGREYSFKAFRRPARLTFFLALANLNPSVDPRNCFSSDLGIASGSPSAEGSQDKKE